MKTFPCRRDGLPKFRNFTCHFRLLTTSLMCLYYDLGLLLIASSVLSATVSAQEEETTTTTITKVTESHSHPGHNHRNHSDVLPTAGFSHHTFPRAPILRYSFFAGNSTSINPIIAFLPNTDALIRGAYVFGGLCFLAVLYLAVRTCRLRRRRRNITGRRTGSRSGSKQYFPLGNAGSQEMEPLGGGGDDEEDEDTLFDNVQQGSGNNAVAQL